jgi:hypothetical protein
MPELLALQIRGADAIVKNEVAFFPKRNLESWSLNTDSMCVDNNQQLDLMPCLKRMPLLNCMPEIKSTGLLA